MRSVFARALLVALVLVVAPPTSQVELVSIPEVVTDELAVNISADTVRLSSTGDEAEQAHRSDPIAASIPFTMVGFRLPEGVDTLRVRTAGDDGKWGEWYDLERTSNEDGPDAGSEEDRGDRSEHYTEPVFVGEATRFQVELPAAEFEEAGGDVQVSATVLDTEGLSGGPVSRKAVTVEGPVAEAASEPSFVSRAQWGAAPYRGDVKYYDNVDLVVVHHTAGSNNYSRSQAPGIVRGIQRYHQDSNGWSDIGYNMLVDRFGTLYEGREGGLGRGVIGAHASSYNVGSFGISVLGNFYEVDAPQAAYETLADGIAWKAAIHGFDPLGTTTRTAKGALVRTITGHRDVGSTACPGRISNRLWWIRTAAAERAPSMPATGPGPLPVDQLFADVPLTAAHHENILTAHETDVLLGYTFQAPAKFEPGTALRRGDMARAVAKGMGLQPASNWEGRFTDVHAGPGGYGWLGPWIVALVDAGVVNGTSEDTFDPGGALRRDQMATFLTKALNLPLYAPNFKDVKNTDSVHYYNIGAIQRAGYTLGATTGTYEPGGTMRRDQSASLLVRAFDLVRPEPEPEPTIEEPLPFPDPTSSETADGDGNGDGDGGLEHVSESD
ncbi:MAG TPA: N-acetylmuramoyl-L-alanine amidase [Egicoccus sp.]|nr:N-acetylmuramoyl-L-alanine amidase [Egicoccus sp.]HSK23155.1 N-acetylmuramoyl-L-alanine amidase [Egicoccus sp.]